MPDLIEMLALMQRRNDQRQQQMQEMQRDQELRSEKAAQSSLDMADAGVEKNKILGVFGDDLSEKHRTLVGIHTDFYKKRKAEREAVGKGGILPNIERLQAAGGPVANRPEGINNAFNEQLAALQERLQGNPDLLAQALTRVGGNQSLIDAEAASAEREARRAYAEKIQFARESQGIKESSQLRVDAAKRERDIQEEQRKKKVEYYSNVLSDAMIKENATPDKASVTTDIINTVIDDPVLGGENAEISLGTIEMNALMAARGAQDANSVVADIEKNAGVKVPLRIGQLVVDGKAVEEPLTGLPFRMPGDQNATRIAMVQNAFDSLARIETYAKRIATSGKITDSTLNSGWTPSGDKYSKGLVALRTSEFARNIGAGIDDADISAYDAAIRAFGLAYTYVTTGATASEKQIKDVQAQFPTLAELSKDKKTGGINPGARRRINSSLSNLMTQVMQGSLVGPALTRQKFTEAYDGKIAEYEQRESVLQALPKEAPVVRKPGLPTLVKPKGF